MTLSRLQQTILKEMAMPVWIYRSQPTQIAATPPPIAGKHAPPVIFENDEHALLIPRRTISCCPLVNVT